MANLHMVHSSRYRKENFNLLIKILYLFTRYFYWPVKRGSSTRFLSPLWPLFSYAEVFLHVVSISCAKISAVSLAPLGQSGSFKVYMPLLFHDSNLFGTRIHVQCSEDISGDF